MKTKNIFQKNVASLSCLLLLCSFNSRLYSQIIYTDITDATPNATFPLDLNNDTIDDFIIQYGGSEGNIGVICYPQNNNAYAGEFVNGTYLSWALATSSAICPSLATWYNSSNPGTLGLGVSTGYWPGVTDKYLALKLVVGTNTYYGWARIDVIATSSSFTLKDYAYQSTPNTCIQAGQNTLGNNDNLTKNNFSVFPNPFISTTTIQTVDNLKNATLTLYNSHGQTVKQVKNISGQTVSLSRDNLSSGLYFIRLEDENKIIAVEKILITD